MGAKLRARLPEGSGLTDELADEMAANPRGLLIVARLQPDDVTRHLDTQTLTTRFEITDLEVVADEANEADMHAMLRRLREARTGESTLPGMSVGDPAEVTRQLDLLRKEEAAKLRERADDEADKATADQLNSDADAYESGSRDAELRALIPQALFSDGAEDNAA